MSVRESRVSSQSTEPKYDYLFKILMVGNSCVGKTSFISMYSKNEFYESFQPTVGIDYWSKHLPSYKDKHNVFIQVWDTAGQERYQSVSNAYYRGANAFILMFDLTNLDSYIACKQWITHVQENAPEDAILVLVGNKCDLVDQRKVTPEEVEAMALSMEIKHFEISVKENTNITEVIEHLIDVLIEQSTNKKPKVETPILLQSTQSSDSSKSKCPC